MSYIIAHVAFRDGEQSYPVNCFRDDIVMGDQVIVRGSEGNLKTAKVVSINFLNWNCKNTIVCRASEAIVDDGRITVPPELAWVRGLTRPEDLYRDLAARGWRRRKPRSKSYRLALSYERPDATARLFFRMNGIDLQVLRGDKKLHDSENLECSFAPSVGEVLRNAYHQSGINVLEHVKALAVAFQGGTVDLSPYWKEHGEANRTPIELKSRPHDFASVLYDVLGGDGGDVYIGDGQYLSKAGRWIDE